MKGTIIAVMGRTRSGKDTIAEVLKEDKGYHKIKFANAMKRFVEKNYNLPHYAMEEPAYRSALVPGTDKTFLDLMIHCYKSHDSIDPLFWIRQSIAQVQIMMEMGETVILTDLRKPEEVEAIIELIDAGKADLHMVFVARPGSPKIESDSSLGANITRLWTKTISHHGYCNDRSLEHLTDFAKALKL